MLDNEQRINVSISPWLLTLLSIILSMLINSNLFYSCKTKVALAA
jgi:hypothetical protein